MYSSLFNRLFQFVLLTTAKYDIDESHGISHSMQVLHYAHNIFLSESPKDLYLGDEEKVIYVSAVLHDMCDKKYVNETEGLVLIDKFLESNKLTIDEIFFIKQIVSTMSYSTVKKYWFPYIPNPSQELAYHIVREADLLASYDFDRAMIFHLKKNKSDINDALKDAEDLFRYRVLNYERDGLFITDYSKTMARTLSKQSIRRMTAWRRLLK